MKSQSSAWSCHTHWTRHESGQWQEKRLWKGTEMADNSSQMCDFDGTTLNSEE